MERSYCIALDVHSRFCEVVAGTPRGRIRLRRSVATSIPALREVIISVPRPRVVVLEEGPMADWLSRHLRLMADRVVVCDPRRNHLICKDGDKDDAIDAEKLLGLARGGYLREVHHSASERRASFKRRVRLYHDRVRQRVAEANRVIWFFRQAGVVIHESAFRDAQAARTLLPQLPDRRWRQDAMFLMAGYHRLRLQEQMIGRELRRLAQQIEEIRRWTALPGIRWIRGATFYAHVDTPWRFRSKAALWKYMGIGLERHRSGDGPTRYRLPRQFNRPLKEMILGATLTATSASSSNPFADRHKELIERGLSPNTARRTVARLLAATMWSMWKTQTEYHPEWIGIPAADLTAVRCGSHEEAAQSTRRCGVVPTTALDLESPLGE